MNLLVFDNFSFGSLKLTSINIWPLRIQLFQCCCKESFEGNFSWVFPCNLVNLENLNVNRNKTALCHLCPSLEQFNSFLLYLGTEIPRFKKMWCYIFVSVHLNRYLTIIILLYVTLNYDFKQVPLGAKLTMKNQLKQLLIIKTDI